MTEYSHSKIIYILLFIPVFQTCVYILFYIIIIYILIQRFCICIEFYQRCRPRVDDEGKTSSCYFEVISSWRALQISGVIQGKNPGFRQMAPRCYCYTV